MNIEKDFEYRIRDLNKKLTQATLDGNVVLAKHITQEIVRTERALESARKLKPITPPVQLPKPRANSAVTAAEILKREAERKRAEEKRRAETKRLTQQVNQYTRGGIVTPKQAGKLELSSAFENLGNQINQSFATLQQQMDKALSINVATPGAAFKGMLKSSETITRNGVKVERKTLVDPHTGDEIVVTLDGNGQVVEMTRMERQFPPSVAKRPSAPSPIEAKIALSRDGYIRCSNEVSVNGCNKYFCEHRDEWFNKIESVGTFSQFVKGGVEMATKTIHLPLCYGLVMAEAVVQVRRVGEENAEGWAEYNIQHALHQGDIVVSMKLTPHKGDTLKAAIRAIEDFYKMQPEHDEVIATGQLRCSNRNLHALDHESAAVSIMYDMGFRKGKQLQDIIATANSFTQLNTPGDDSLCILCYRKRWMLP